MLLVQPGNRHFSFNRLSFLQTPLSEKKKFYDTGTMFNCECFFGGGRVVYEANFALRQRQPGGSGGSDHPRTVLSVRHFSVNMYASATSPVLETTLDKKPRRGELSQATNCSHSVVAPRPGTGPLRLAKKSIANDIALFGWPRPARLVL